MKDNPFMKLDAKEEFENVLRLAENIASPAEISIVQENPYLAIEIWEREGTVFSSSAYRISFERVIVIDLLTTRTAGSKE